MRCAIALATVDAGERLGGGDVVAVDGERALVERGGAGVVVQVLEGQRGEPAGGRVLGGRVAVGGRARAQRLQVVGGVAPALTGLEQVGA